MPTWYIRMLPAKELFLIALAHAKSGATFLYDKRGVPAFRLEMQTDMIGLFIPVSSYYATEKVESMTTYELRDAGIFNDEELEFVKEMDKVNILDDDKWVEELERNLDDECEAGDE